MTDILSPGQFRAEVDSCRALIDRRLSLFIRAGNPRDLNNAVRYIIDGGGKRIRSLLVLLTSGAVGGRIQDSVHAAAAVELLHNFTLVHDDVMDNAPARRGRPTVHVKWDISHAILVGDVILGMAYESILSSRRGNSHTLTEALTRGLREVCEGQALDMELGRERNVSVRRYFRMIEKKTGSLIALAAELGAIVGGGTRKQVRSAVHFGRYLGTAFQLQDDLLDVVADEDSFGKKIGGDILEAKMTILFLKTLERANGNDKNTLLREFDSERRTLRGRKLIACVTDLYHKYQVVESVRRMVTINTQHAVKALAGFPQNKHRAMLEHLAGELLRRET